jgi:hypothetical protein
MLQDTDYQILDSTLKAFTSLLTVKGLVQPSDADVVVALLSRIGSISIAGKTINNFLAALSKGGVVSSSQLIEKIDCVMESQMKPMIALQRFSAVKEV